MTVLWPQPGPNNAARTTPDQSDTHIPSHQFKSSHMWALAFYPAIWRFRETGDPLCKPRTFASTWRLSANDTYFSVNSSIFEAFLAVPSFPPTGLLTSTGKASSPCFYPAWARNCFFISFLKLLALWWAPATCPLQSSPDTLLSVVSVSKSDPCCSLGLAHIRHQKHPTNCFWVFRIF